MSEPDTALPDETSDTQEVDVQRIHAPVYREHDEPRDGLEPIPVWMGMAFGALLFWGGMYMATNAGDYRGDVYDCLDPKPPTYKVEVIPTDEAGLKKLGERIYFNCVACHQMTGEGTPNQFPALNKSDWVAGDKASVARLARIVLYGLSGEVTVRDAKFNGAMPAWGGQLKDYQIAAVLTYIRSNWDNKAGPVFPVDVAAARKAVGARATALTVGDLEKVAVDYVDPGATAPAVAGKK